VGRFKGKCNFCGKKGHKKAQCFMNPENKSKRPSWFKPSETNDGSGEEVNAAVIDDESGNIWEK